MLKTELETEGLGYERKLNVYNFTQLSLRTLYVWAIADEPVKYVHNTTMEVNLVPKKIDYKINLGTFVYMHGRARVCRLLKFRGDILLLKGIPQPDIYLTLG